MRNEYDTSMKLFSTELVSCRSVFTYVGIDLKPGTGKVEAKKRLGVNTSSLRP